MCQPVALCQISGVTADILSASWSACIRIPTFKSLAKKKGQDRIGYGFRIEVTISAEEALAAASGVSKNCRHLQMPKIFCVPFSRRRTFVGKPTMLASATRPSAGLPGPSVSSHAGLEASLAKVFGCGNCRSNPPPMTARPVP